MYQKKKKTSITTPGSGNMLCELPIGYSLDNHPAKTRKSDLTMTNRYRAEISFSDDKALSAE